MGKTTFLTIYSRNEDCKFIHKVVAVVLTAVEAVLVVVLAVVTAVLVIVVAEVIT